MKPGPGGHALSLFIAISFLICIGWGLVLPDTLHMHDAWEDWLPGFEFLTLQGFIIGLIESNLYGWYTALVFMPLDQFFDRTTGDKNEKGNVRPVRTMTQEAGSPGTGTATPTARMQCLREEAK